MHVSTCLPAVHGHFQLRASRLCYLLKHDPSPLLAVSVKVTESLQLSVYVRGLRVREERLRWIFEEDIVLHRWSQFQNVLSHFGALSENDVAKCDPADIITDVVKKLRTLSTISHNDLHIHEAVLRLIIEQLELPFMRSAIVISAPARYCSRCSCTPFLRRLISSFATIWFGCHTPDISQRNESEINSVFLGEVIRTHMWSSVDKCVSVYITSHRLLGAHPDSGTRYHPTWRTFLLALLLRSLDKSTCS